MARSRDSTTFGHWRMPDGGWLAENLSGLTAEQWRHSTLCGSGTSRTSSPISPPRQA